ncbi:MAG TPA: RIP metalloprotease RseP [Cyanobacteria bacterium UBA11149]|nr:RIP metalloprotease RseP [Cyanobacteria bacterium UBA11367]HBK64136.1 RIP metalloprotease RseP [Cyanobacteria bacterium UBA11166]HBR75061.1 RIP metalloprotease RseP [Cyanobacteria bacterium UBA11159]HBS71833.1 RIP metalloprotease RseP [Cyanobacteria bacterium UBA11153]HBW89612.1 RIP metalloprotease RseP [Cyanobacteria bacterium UBA11149]HCA93232.1 RIP metalloprotease RseP [Cyanobacteria bacterium UBA9226]
MSVLAAIAVLAVLIVVHELGHFMAARLQGIYANRFSLGFGPILWKYQGSQTEYAVRALPLGGFVGFPDEDPDSDIPLDDPNLLSNRPILDRAIVISAGVIANLVFAYFLLVIQSGIVGIPDFINKPGVLISEVAPQSSLVAQNAGIKAGDVILAVNGQDLALGKDGIVYLQEKIQKSPNQSLNLKIQREEKTFDIALTPELKNGNGMIGVSLNGNIEVIHSRADNILTAFNSAAKEYQRITVLILQGFGKLISNFQETANQVSGPVAIIDIGAKIASSDPFSLFQFAALISINLAIINILPLPALDGGQLAFLLIEAISGKPLPSGIQQNIMQTGLFLLLGLGIFLILRDTANLLPASWMENFLQ